MLLVLVIFVNGIDVVEEFRKLAGKNVIEFVIEEVEEDNEEKIEGLAIIGEVAFVVGVVWEIVGKDELEVGDD